MTNTGASAASAAAAPAGGAAPPREGGATAILDAGGAIKDVVGLTDGDLEAVYGLAYQLYEQGQHEYAEKAFGVLCFSDHRSPRYWMGLGATRQVRKNYEGAVLAYSMVAECGSTDPLAPLHAAECYLALGLYDEAISGLRAAVAWAEGGADGAAVVDRAEVVAEALGHLMAVDATSRR